MVWTRIRTSPSNWGGLPGPMVPYTTYCCVNKGYFDCQQLPHHMNCSINASKNHLSEHSMEIISWTGSRNTKFCSLRMKIEKTHEIESLSYPLWATSTWILACGVDIIHAFKHFSSNGFPIGPMKRRELGDRLHSVNLDTTAHNYLKLIVMPCFGFLPSLYTSCLEQKWQTMEQYLKSNSMKALTIFILQASLSLILVQIKDNQFSKPVLA